MSGAIAQDLRFGVRSFLRTPRVTIPAVLVLALGIGATSAIFSVVHGVMLAPLPYRDPERIVVVWETNLSRNRLRNVIAPANFVAWRERARSFEQLGMVGPSRANFMLNGQPEEIAGLAASSDVFRALGVEPALGRTYTPAEDERGSHFVLLLSHEFWQTRLGGRDDVLGLSLTFNGQPRTVVGVMPPGFTMFGQKADYYTPYGWSVEQLRSAAGRGSSHGLARLREGVSLAQAADEMRSLMMQLEQEAPQRNAGWSVTLVPVHEQMVEQIRPALLVLSGAVLLVLLIACVNVANLLLARSTVRQRELGLRTALGANRSRLIRQVLTESLLLASVGGVAGLALAVAFHRGLLALVATRIPVPRLDQVSLDLFVVAVTMAGALGTAVIFGLVPALVATDQASEALREGGRHGGSRRSRRVLGVLVAAELVLSFVLLAGAGLLLRSFVRLQNIDPGFRPANLLTARVQLPSARYGEPVQSAAFFTSVISRVETLPGVRSAAAVTFLPLAGLGIGTSFFRADQPEPAAGQAPSADVKPVTPSFFRTMGIPMLAGRDFTPSDTVDGPQIAIVSAALVRRHLAGENPLGHRLRVNIGPPGGLNAEIVGVVGDIAMTTLEGEARPAVYVPHTQLAIGVMSFVVRTDVEPTSLTKSLAQAVQAVDPELPVGQVQTMEEVVDATLARPRTVSVLLAAFALMALVLAGIGVYGVMAYAVSQRTQEIGVRMALGATAQSVRRLVLGQALRLVAGGVVAGLLAAVALTRVLESMLYETAPLDPATLAASAVLLVLVAALASYLPARRATRVDPLALLRAE
ncbi:MAG: ABC transporter permease [Acidobacteriota bacterium]